MPHHMNDHTPEGGQVALSDEQFAKLVELLTPGYELSKLFLAQHAADIAARERDVAMDQPAGGNA